MKASIRAGLNSRTSRKQLTRIAETHSPIVDAIELRQAARAGYTMKVHFDEAKNALREVAAPSKCEIVPQSAAILQALRAR